MSENCCCGAAATPPPPAASCCGPSTETPDAAAPCCCGPEKATPAPEKLARGSSCCGSSPHGAVYSYGPAPYLKGQVQTPVGPVPRLSTELTGADRIGAWKMRWGFSRSDYRVRPGLYALGDPDPASPVLVTCNYKLTVDSLRSVLPDLDAWVLVVDTVGINVWCAAGKGTFSAGEVARVVDETRLAEVVEHRRLVLPQLAAPGVAAHKVKEACGFRVTYGPVRASDIPRFLENHMKADADMRTVTFDFDERLVLAPAELNYLWDRRLLLAYAGVVAASSVDRDGVSLRRGLRRGLPVIGAAGLAVLAGGGVTPLLLPWLPGRAFSLKGATAGVGVALATDAALRGRLTPAARLTLLAGVPALASYAAMNFTGSSPITSPSGVQQEMRRALPFQIAGAAVAVGGWLATRLGR